MDAHARSLLDLLNTSSSPKYSKLSTPEKSATPTPVTKNSDKSEEQKTPISLLSRTSHNGLEGPDASLSLKDLLLSARKSRETSAEAEMAPEQPKSGEEDIRSYPTNLEANSAPPLEENSPQAILHTSDGETSEHHEEIPTTPSGSNKSSIVSTVTEAASDPIKHTSSLTGYYINDDVPSSIMLPPIDEQIPRSDISADGEECTYMGLKVKPIANIPRTFSSDAWDVISATTNYIAYTLESTMAFMHVLILDGRIRILDQNTGTRAIAETPTCAPVTAISIRDGIDPDEAVLLAVDKAHDITIWAIKPWKIDSADIPYMLNMLISHRLDYLIRFQAGNQRPDEPVIPVAKWWPRSANCLAVCIDSVIHLCDFADSLSGQTVNLSAEAEHAVTITVETGIRDFDFSADGSALAVADNYGNILFWALCQEPEFEQCYRTPRLTAKFNFSHPNLKYSLLPDSTSCSIQFLGFGEEHEVKPFTPLVLVGLDCNRRLQLIDIGEGRTLQEIVLPAQTSEKLPAQNVPLCFAEDKQILMVGDTSSQVIYFFHLQSPPLVNMIAKSQSDYVKYIAESKFPATAFQEGKMPAFDYVTEISFFKNHHLQTLATAPSVEAYLDVFTAHNNGFTMLLPEKDDLFPSTFKEAKRAPSRSIFNPHLSRVESVSRFEETDSPPHTPSRGSSTESVRSERATRTQLAKRRSRDTSKRKPSPAAEESPTRKSPKPKNTPDDASPKVRSQVISSDMPEIPVSTPEKDTSQKDLASLAQELQSIFNKALDQQCMHALLLS
jgi:hypothetical protein